MVGCGSVALDARARAVGCDRRVSAADARRARGAVRKGGELGPGRQGRRGIRGSGLSGKGGASSAPGEPDGRSCCTGGRSAAADKFGADEHARPGSRRIASPRSDGVGRARGGRHINREDREAFPPGHFHDGAKTSRGLRSKCTPERQSNASATISSKASALPKYHRTRLTPHTLQPYLSTIVQD